MPTHGFSPCHIVIDKLDRYAFISNYMGKFVMIALEPNGHFGNTTHILDFDKIESSNSRQDSSHPHSIILSPDERFCYFQDLGTDKIMVFEVDYQNGKFVPIQEVSIKPGAGPRHFVFHPLIPFAYCINELDSTITSFSFDKETGKLTIFENVPTIPSEYEYVFFFSLLYIISRFFLNLFHLHICNCRHYFTKLI